MRGPAVLVALAAALAGCGGDDKEAARAIQDAVARTAEAAPLAIDETATIHAGPDRTVTLKLNGIADGRSRTLRARIEGTWRGPAGARPTKPEREFDELDGEMAEEGERLYLRVASLDRALGLRGRWFLLDPEDPVAREGGFTGASSLGTLDATRPVDHLRAADSVKRIGEDRGATRYRMVIDYGRYQGLIDEKRRRSLAPELAKLKKATRTDRHPMEAWVDPQGRISRIEGRIRNVLGSDLIKYTIDLTPTRETPRIPRDALTYEDLPLR